MRMRTSDEAFRMLQNEDKKTQITKHALRMMVLSGKIPSISIGRKRLINYDQMLEILQNPQRQEESTPEYGVIRRIG